jgi:hypothetical protein
MNTQSKFTFDNEADIPELTVTIDPGQSVKLDLRESGNRLTIYNRHSRSCAYFQIKTDAQTYTDDLIPGSSCTLPLGPPQETFVEITNTGQLSIVAVLYVIESRTIAPNVSVEFNETLNEPLTRLKVNNRHATETAYFSISFNNDPPIAQEALPNGDATYDVRDLRSVTVTNNSSFAIHAMCWKAYD